MTRSNNEITVIYERNVDTVYRVCYGYMQNIPDTENAVQDTFVNLIKADPKFDSLEHEKAWLIRVASNVCKNNLKKWRKNETDIADCDVVAKADNKQTYVMDCVKKLPDKYKTVIYLYYYEGYTSVEIADMLKKPNSTIRNYLHEARTLLKEMLGEDFNEEE
jgi:RNA polymerase sigma-70 factor (ECF subfamily)